MIQKICPICDNPMSNSFFCTHCKSFVKKPLEKRGSYRLNESHPRGEADCEYHNPSFMKPVQENKGKQAVPQPQVMKSSPVAPEWAPMAKREELPSINKIVKIIKWVFLIYIALSAVVPLLFSLLVQLFL